MELWKLPLRSSIYRWHCISLQGPGPLPEDTNPRDRQGCCEKPSVSWRSFMDSQQLWFLAHDLYKVEPGNIPLWIGNRLMKLHP